MAEFELWLTVLGVVAVFLGLYADTYFRMKSERTERKKVVEAAERAEKLATIEAGNVKALSASADALKAQVTEARRVADANVAQVQELKKTAGAAMEQVAQLKKLVEAAQGFLTHEREQVSALRAKLEALTIAGLKPDDREIALEQQRLQLQKEDQDWKHMLGLWGTLLGGGKKKGK